MSRRPRKIKPLNPEEQHQILQYISSNKKDSSTPESHSTKKRRRSTGEKSSSNKRVNLPSDIHSKEESNSSTKEALAQQQITERMSNIQVNKTDSNSPMLEEIMKMEARLTVSITTGRQNDISELESRLNENIKSTIGSSIKEALKVMQSSICTSVQNNPTIKSHSKEIEGLHEENLRLNRKVQQLSAEQHKMKNQLTKIESKHLDRSLIIKGITEEFKETEAIICEKIHQIFSNIMQGDTGEEKLVAARRILIKNCKRLGCFNSKRIRPISVELTHQEDIEFILENRFDLEKGVYIDREYPVETERKRKTLLPVLRAAKRLPGYKRQSKLEDDKLVLKGRPYTISTLNQLPEELNVFKVTTKENETTVGFFGEINPLSNFHPSAFKHDGIHYILSEQFIQANKTKYFGDLESYNMILGCATSLECKNLAKQIRNVDNAKWEEVASNICHPGIRAKFQQNPIAMDALVHRTGNKRIVECATDRLWATGLPLNDPSSLDETKWISQGILGQILENIRSEQVMKMDHVYHTYPQAASLILLPHQLASGIPLVSRPIPSAPQMIPGAICNPTGLPTGDGSTTLSDATSISASTIPVSDTTATDTDTGDTLCNTIAEDPMVMDSINNSVPT